MSDNGQEDKRIKVTGALVFLELDDGEIRAVQLNDIENMKTIVTVCQLDGHGKINLGDKDFSDELRPHIKTEDESNDS